MSKYGRFWYAKMGILMIVLLIGMAYGCYIAYGEKIMTMISNIL